MKYFLIQRDSVYSSIPNIKNIPTNLISTMDLRDKKYSKFPNVSTLPIYESENLEFIDIISSPFLLVTDTCYRVIKMYQPYISSKKIVLSNQTHNKMYHLPIIPRICCLTENSKISADGSSIHYCELEYEKIKHHGLFYIGDITENAIVFRLDVLESMLKRGVKGLVIKEIDIRGV